jgi:hypothetical protein
MFRMAATTPVMRLHRARGLRGDVTLVGVVVVIAYLLSLLPELLV